MSIKKSIPWWEPQIGSKEFYLVNKVLKSNFPNEGKFTLELEEKIAKLINSKHAIVVNNATSAMYLSLKALNIGYGDEVIVPDLTFIATANAVEMTGAKAILADIDPSNLTLDPKSAEKTITKKTKAIIFVEVAGIPGNLESVIKLAKKYKLFVVEDAAEAFSSKHKNKYLGTFGDAGCFSFSPAKIITTGQGGAISVNSEKMANKIRELKDHGRPKRGTGGDDIHYSIGFNFKFTDLQAAVGLGQLNYLDKRKNRLIRNYNLYKRLLAGIDSVSLCSFKAEEGELPLWIQVKAKNRKELTKHLDKNNISYRKFWFPIHKQIPYKDSDRRFPNSTKLSPQLLWLPSSYTLTDREINFVCNEIKNFYNKHESQSI